MLILEGYVGNWDCWEFLGQRQVVFGPGPGGYSEICEDAVWIQIHRGDDGGCQGDDCAGGEEVCLCPDEFALQGLADLTATLLGHADSVGFLRKVWLCAGARGAIAGGAAAGRWGGLEGWIGSGAAVALAQHNLSKVSTDFISSIIKHNHATRSHIMFDFPVKERTRDTLFCVFLKSRSIGKFLGKYRSQVVISALLFPTMTQILQLSFFSTTTQVLQLFFPQRHRIHTSRWNCIL